MFELHVWGPLENFVSLSPECMAIAWYLGLALDPSEFVIIPSSNTTIASNGQLPALRHAGHVYGGFFSIVRYLLRINVELPQKDSDIDEAKVTALANYISTNISSLTLYTMYVHRQNFESVTRPLFTELVPFPMQYNLPLHQRDLAKRQCTHQGLIGQPESTQLSVKYPASLSKLQAQIEEKNKQRQKIFDDAKENLRTLACGQKLYRTVVDFKENRNSPFLLGSTITIADLLFISHLRIQTASVFPVPVLKTLIDTQFPELQTYLKLGLDELKPVEATWKIVAPQGREVYSFSNAILHYIGL
ncbi:SAM complex subunit SAM37 [Sugiyamaella lignohabitans]|uniref:SAM complex subunit SAM37 n=1 Tax=Sugiyamaella lignohabitans TaxID=796027 RepID=A0A167FU00_9ASCO|nr:SAM complex subunit SAM37 [Sugiyamaella lignohabitans]ANB15702.1 SAM complex subunit SAM37 [Sugiyamaella lignohabitans]